MDRPFRAVKITDRVHWVGAVDWGLRDFHGYATSRGSTYNAYLVLGDPVTLIDTVKAPFVDEMLDRIASVVDPSRVRIIVSNHSELDHAGGLPRTIAAVRPDRVIASAMGVKALRGHFHWDQPLHAPQDGETLRLGDLTLRFIETRMLHWPDSMFTYLEEERLLFSQDAFGMHLAGAARFADEFDTSVLHEEAAKYFANILLPYSGLITRLIGRLPELRIAPRIIAPDHGPIWRERPEQIVEWYAEWAMQRPRRKAVVVFDTMWQSTDRMARAVGEGLAAGGLGVALLPLAASHRSDIATALLGAGALLVGSPTLNNQVFPTVADVMAYLKGLRPRNLVGAAFGSYGWSGEAVAQIEEMLREMKVELVAEGVKAIYVPDAEVLARCRVLGETVAARVVERVPVAG
jgi:flavorubredoxin